MAWGKEMLLYSRYLAGREAKLTKSIHSQVFLESWNFLFWRFSYRGFIGKLIKQIACKRVNIKIACKNARHHLCCHIWRLYPCLRLTSKLLCLYILIDGKKLEKVKMCLWLLYIHIYLNTQFWIRISSVLADTFNSKFPLKYLLVKVHVRL